MMVVESLVGIGLVALVVWGVSSLRNTRTSPEETPLEILRRRYARGEISQEEFEQARRTLG